MEHLTGRTILVVEDVFLIASALESELLRNGAALVRLAPSAARAQEILGTACVDVAVLDVNLEDTSCFALADRLASSGVPFLFATALPPSEIPDRFAHVPTFEKPYALGALVAAVADLVGGVPTGSNGWPARSTDPQTMGPGGA